MFLERIVPGREAIVRVRWQGRNYDVAIPQEASPPAFLTIEGVDDPPPGELVLVLQKKGGWLRLFQRPPVFVGVVEAEPVDD